MGKMWKMWKEGGERERCSKEGKERNRERWKGRRRRKVIKGAISRPQSTHSM